MGGVKKICMSNEFSESLIMLCTRVKSRLKMKEGMNIGLLKNPNSGR